MKQNSAGNGIGRDRLAFVLLDVVAGCLLCLCAIYFWGDVRIVHPKGDAHVAYGLVQLPRLVPVFFLLVGAAFFASAALLTAGAPFGLKLSTISVILVFGCPVILWATQLVPFTMRMGGIHTLRAGNLVFHRVISSSVLAAIIALLLIGHSRELMRLKRDRSEDR